MLQIYTGKSFFPSSFYYPASMCIYQTNSFSPKGTTEAVAERVHFKIFPYYMIDEPQLALQQDITISDFLKVPKTFTVRMCGLMSG